jgi:broad specificity phosphatase PhoE
MSLEKTIQIYLDSANATVVRLKKRRHREGHHAHELDEDVERRARRVLERVADRVAHDARVVVVRSKVVFDCLIVAGTSGAPFVSHKLMPDAACYVSDDPLAAFASSALLLQILDVAKPAPAPREDPARGVRCRDSSHRKLLQGSVAGVRKK